jgi:hypothetical protein
MIAYIERAAGKTFQLRICARPCNGAEYMAAPTVAVAGKREANAYCKANGIKPWNF